MYSSLISQPPVGGSHGEDNNWEEEAECRNHDSKLFILSENPEDKEVNRARFEEAEVICSTCPVITQCWQAATGIDKRVTMRGGAWPTLYSEPEVIRPKRTHCAHGHDISDPSSKDSKGRCHQCARERVRAYRARVAAAKKA